MEKIGHISTVWESVNNSSKVVMFYLRFWLLLQSCFCALTLSRNSCLNILEGNDDTPQWNTPRVEWLIFRSKATLLPSVLWAIGVKGARLCFLELKHTGPGCLTNVSAKPHACSSPPWPVWEWVVLGVCRSEGEWEATPSPLWKNIWCYGTGHEEPWWSQKQCYTHDTSTYCMYNML